MNSRDRIQCTLGHKEPDILPVDFGGGPVTGIAVQVVYQLRQRLGLDKPGTHVKVIEPYQMLGEIKPDLQDALGLDVVSVNNNGTMFGFDLVDWKEWTTPDGTPVLVPGLFNTNKDNNGDILQYPKGNAQLQPCAKMPKSSYFFDAIDRQQPINEEMLDPKDNLEDFELLKQTEIDHYRLETDRLFTETHRAIYSTLPGVSFGDVALVPGLFLENPRGVRSVEEWYMSSLTRPDYIKAVYEQQAEIALQNLKTLYETVGDKISVIQINGTDFGTQNGPFCSKEQYRDLYLPYQKKLNDWIHANTPWKTFIHSCGGIYPLLDEIAEAGFDILNPVQSTAKDMELPRLKKEYGDTFVFWGGGVDTQNIFPFGTPEQVKEDVKQRIEILGDGGGFVFSTIHNIVANAPIDNVLAMFEVIKDYR